MTEKETLSTSKKADAKIPKHRSPNYPFIGLADALDRLAQLHELGRGHFVPVKAARDKWEYQQNAGDRTVAALRAYGLVEVTGESEKRQLKPTDSGLKILENHSQKDALIKAAALMPALHGEIWVKYSGNLPRDPVIKEFLRWDKNFNPDNIDKFLKQFRETIAFANLSTSDIMDTDEGAVDTSIVQETPENTGRKDKNLKQSTLAKGVMFNINIDVLENGEINVTNGGALTSETFEILKEVFDLKKRHEIEPTSEQPASNERNNNTE